MSEEQTPKLFARAALGQTEYEDEVNQMKVGIWQIPEAKSRENLIY